MAAKHVGSFMLLILVSVIQPTAIWSGLSIALEPVAVLLVGLLLLTKIALGNGFVAFFKRYSVELSLLVVYQLLCLVTLFLNKHRYADTAELIRYGFTFIFITAAFPAALLLFLQPQNSRGPSLSRFKYSAYVPWCFFVFAGLLALWQAVDYATAKALTGFFVASEVWPQTNVNGVFRISTDLGVIMGVAITTLLSLKLFGDKVSTGSAPGWLLSILLLVLCLGGIASGARVFLLVLLVALAGFAWQLRKHNWRLALACILAAVSLFHLFVMLTPIRTAFKLSYFMPYLSPLRQGELLFWSDLWPSVNVGVFGDRIPNWTLAIELLKEHWLFGTSNGGYRLAGEHVYQNSHTIVFQILIDSGIIGFMVLLALGARIVSRSRGNMPLAITALVIFVGLLVDFQVDHSMPWIISCAYLLAMCAGAKPTALNADVKAEQTGKVKTPIALARTKHIENGLFVLAAVAFVSCITLYTVRYSDNTKLDTQARIASFVGARPTQQLILMDKTLGFDFNYRQSRDVLFGELVNELSADRQLCLYRYNDNKVMHKHGAPVKVDQPETVVMGDVKVDYYSVAQLNCDGFDYPEVLGPLNRGWIASYSYFLHNTERQDLPLWGNASLYSPLMQAQTGGYQLQFAARGDFALEQWPQLKVQILRADGQLLAAQQLEINSAGFIDFTVDFHLAEPARVYLVLAYINDARDAAINEDRNVFLLANSFTIRKLKP